MFVWLSFPLRLLDVRVAMPSFSGALRSIWASLFWFGYDESRLSGLGLRESTAFRDVAMSCRSSRGFSKSDSRHGNCHFDQSTELLGRPALLGQSLDTDSIKSSPSRNISMGLQVFLRSTSSLIGQPLDTESIPSGRFCSSRRPQPGISMLSTSWPAPSRIFSMGYVVFDESAVLLGRRPDTKSSTMKSIYRYIDSRTHSSSASSSN